jgi:SAM-dependent methyltransferase
MMKGFAEKLPFEDNFFDLIVSNNGINNVADHEKALNECFRVSRKGAQMVITVNLPETMIEFYDVFEETLRKHEMQVEIGKMKEHIFEKRKPVDYLKALIEKSGFTVRDIKTDGFKYRYVDGTAFFNHFLIRNYFMPSWLSIVSDDSQQMIFDEIESSLNEIAGKKGELVMTIPFVCVDSEKDLSPLSRKDAK